MRNPRSRPTRPRVLGAAIGLAIAGCIGAASVPVFVSHRDAHQACQDRTTPDGTDACTRTQVGSVSNPTP